MQDQKLSAVSAAVDKLQHSQLIIKSTTVGVALDPEAVKMSPASIRKVITCHLGLTW